MPRMPDSSTPKWVICSNCEDTTKHWSALQIADIFNGNDITVILCLQCLDMVSLLLDIDLAGQSEGLLCTSALGAVRCTKKDNN